MKNRLCSTSEFSFVYFSFLILIQKKNKFTFLEILLHSYFWNVEKKTTTNKQK